MRNGYSAIGVLGLLGLLGGAAITGCTSGGGSGRGESCRARNDCNGGLACVNFVCTLNDFDVAETAESCDRIECANDADCCPALSTTCTTWQRECAMGDQFSCQDFDRSCRCRRSCVEDRCIATCAIDSDCGSGSCVAGRCVQCETNDDCVGDQFCDAGTCRAGCTSNGDCPYLNTCDAGRCVETGCTTHHECIAISGNPRSVCSQTRCTTPCENDAECNIGGYRFQACSDGQCEYVGCQSNEECRIFLDIEPGSSVTAVCR